MKKILMEFFLTPDGGSARKVKRFLAQQAPGLYRLAGTWLELMVQTTAAYLLPPTPEDWMERLRQTASRQKDAFWLSSLKVAPQETLAELHAAIVRLLEGAGLSADPQALMDTIPTNERLHRRVSDLLQLVESASGIPDHLQQMADLLDANDPPLRPIRVYYPPDMDLNAWQMAVLQKLACDAPAPDPALQALLDSARTLPKTSIPALQAARNLFSDRNAPPRGIDGVRVIAVRDSLAEAEIVAGLVQKAIENDSDVSEIGLLLPNDSLSLMAVENAFNRCGLALSGFHRPAGRRDLGRETLRSFLLCLRKPAPIMAVASLLTSPLLPWEAEEGQALAQAVMEGDVLLRSTTMPVPAHKVMDLVDQGAATPAELQRRLNRFVHLLTAEEAFHAHHQRAMETALQLQETLSGMVELDWEPLLYQTNPETLSENPPVDYWQEGIPVFHEDVRPWCAVKHLFVLGFNDGHFPSGPGSSAVFTEAEWEEIAASGWPVATNDLIRKRWREVFAEQIGAATESLTLLFARRDALGQALEPSASLVFLARSLGVETDSLVLDLDRSEDVRRISDLPMAPKAQPSPPRTLPAADIELGVDLLEAFGRKAGGMAPLSPSAADTLMVSPFAWLLGRMGCDPRTWGVDEFDVLTAGTLAHRVFEELFQPGLPLPDEDEINRKVHKILRERVLQIAPFLRSPDWRVERFKFESEILRAAVHWKKLLASCGATVVGAEQWLRGQHGEIPLHGQSDLLVGLPSGRMLVVDYKKSSSSKRRDRMRSGFDLQAHLYRVMIQSGGLPGFDPPPEEVGIVYYLMNDTRALADSPVEADGSVPGWEVLINDISALAMRHLDRRLTQIRRGVVRLNSTDDEKWWEENAGLPIYALDNSPLLRLFMHPETAEGA